jgi:hypothetical protein
MFSKQERTFSLTVGMGESSFGECICLTADWVRTQKYKKAVDIFLNGSQDKQRRETNLS